MQEVINSTVMDPVLCCGWNTTEAEAPVRRSQNRTMTILLPLAGPPDWCKF